MDILAPSGTTTLPSVPAGRRAVVRSRPTVKGVLKRWAHTWRCCMGLLGVCDDGIPLAARFTNPERGTHWLYAAGDEATLALLVEPLLYSIAAQPEYGRDRIRYAIVSHGTQWDARVVEAPHCAGVAAPESEDGRNLLPMLNTMMKVRQGGRAKTPQVQTIVVLHDLGAWAGAWSGEAWALWPSLLAEAHQVGIHLVVTMRYEHLQAWEGKLPRQVLYGAPAPGQPLPNTPKFRNLMALGLAAMLPYEGVVKADQAWHRFTVPAIG